jgi:hypothetical protein
MNKNGFVLTVIIAGFVVLMNSCASFGAGFDTAMVDDTATAGVIIQITNSVRSGTYFDTFTVYIDNKEIGTIGHQEIKGYKLKNGIHTIYFYVYNGNYNLTGDRERTFPIQFTINNDRHQFNVSRGYRNEEFTPVSVEHIQPVPVTRKPSSARPVNTNLINTAINNSFEAVLPDIPANSKIALINIASSDKDESSFILEELRVLFVNSRQFTIVDRQTLDAIRREQNFQLSLEVSDETAVSIGKFTGADVVITGTVSGAGSLRRLRLYVLDVKTAQVLAASSEKI